MFNQEGNFAVTITEAFFASSQFGGEGVSDIVVKVQAKPGQGVDGQSDYWRGELSNRQGRGNNADKTQFQLTMATLENLEIPQSAFIQDPAGACGALVGKESVAWISSSVKDGKTYFNVRSIVDSGRSFQRIDPAAIGAQLQAMAQGGGQPTFAPQQAAAQAPAQPPTQTWPPQGQQPAPAAQAQQPGFPQQQFAPAPAPTPSPFG